MMGTQNLKLRNQNYQGEEETSKALQQLFYEYTHLPIGGKEIICPYWMNNLKRGIFGPLGGKGSPEEIVKTTEDEAKKEKIDLTKLTEEDIVVFMKMKKIGVDCSGFVFWMLNKLDLERGGRGISGGIHGREAPLSRSRVNVSVLTDDKISRPVLRTEELKVGDIIRIRRGKHLLIILSLGKEGQIIKEVEYAHSSSTKYTEKSGVHKGKIIIKDHKKVLEEQDWLEKTPEGQSYSVCFYPSFGDGPRRLKIFT